MILFHLNDGHCVGVGPDVVVGAAEAVLDVVPGHGEGRLRVVPRADGQLFQLVLGNLKPNRTLIKSYFRGDNCSPTPLRASFKRNNGSAEKIHSS